jgi:hypothetical protein
MQFFHEDSCGNIVDDKGKEATTFVEEKSFRLRKLTDLEKFIEN